MIPFLFGVLIGTTATLSIVRGALRERDRKFAEFLKKALDDVAIVMPTIKECELEKPKDEPSNEAK